MIGSIPSDHRRLYDAADAIYGEDPVDGYRIYRRYDDAETGFRAAQLKPVLSLDHVVFTCCGTQWWENNRPTIRDALADLNMGIDQFRSPAGAALLGDALALAEKGIALAFTGHSLGDSLGKTFAYFVAHALKHKTGTELPIQAVGFAGFGARELITALDDGGFDANLSHRTRPLTYFIAADPVPRIGTHTGKTLRIPEDALLPEAVARLDLDFERFDTSPYGLLGVAVLHHRTTWRHVVHKRNGLERAQPETPERLAWATRLGDPTNRLPELDAVRNHLRDLAERNHAEARGLYSALRLSVDDLVNQHRDKARDWLIPVGDHLAQSMDRLVGHFKSWTESQGEKPVIQALQEGLNLLRREGASPGAMVPTDGTMDSATQERLTGVLGDIGPAALDRLVTLGRFYLFLKESDSERWTGLAEVIEPGEPTLALQRALNDIGGRRLAESWVALAEDGDPNLLTAAACRAVFRSIGAERLALAYGHGLGFY